MEKQFAVLGLGSFGYSVAMTLEQMGCDVLVLDDSYEKIQDISDKVSYAIKANASDPDALQALGGRNLDGVVIALSDNLEASIMATMICKEMEIPLVLAKAKDKLQGEILKRVGADRVVYGQVVWQIVQFLLKPQELYDLHDEFLIRLPPVQGNRKNDVLPHTQHRHQIVVLEDEADLFSSEDSGLLAGELCKLCIANADAALRGGVQPAQHI